VIEFQGGEPFLNFPAIVQMVEAINRLNSSNLKKISFGVVSNLMVVRDDQLQYCVDNKIKIAYSLNGPQPLHDLFRITRSGSGSHEAVIRRINDIKLRFPGLLASYPLCVVTDTNVTQLTNMADYYFDLGYTELGLIHLKNLGNARGKVRFDMRSFVPHYFKLLDHIYDKNRRSPDSWYSERIAKLALQKILLPSNPLFVDWRNPIGYFSNCIIYDTDGEILPVDEARSLKEIFSLGNVRTATYDELIRKRSSFDIINLSIRDRDSVCRECTYNPYCGVSPVLHYAKTGKLAPEPHVSDECVLVMAVFDWMFKKLTEEDPIPLLKMVPDYMSAVRKRIVPDIKVQETCTAYGTMTEGSVPN
jgi:radical SAM protein with 4Fe4S-binding SPASM domain